MIIKQLKGISCHLPSWGGNGGGKILSCADAVSKAIEWYLENFERCSPASEARRRGRPAAVKNASFPPAMRRSPAAPVRLRQPGRAAGGVPQVPLLRLLEC